MTCNLINFNTLTRPYNTHYWLYSFLDLLRSFINLFLILRLFLINILRLLLLNLLFLINIFTFLSDSTLLFLPFFRWFALLFLFDLYFLFQNKMIESFTFSILSYLQEIFFLLTSQYYLWPSIHFPLGYC
jgi:hypothetical protein